LRFVVRAAAGAPELVALKAQTTGTAVIAVEYSADESLEVTFQKISYSAVEIAETDGLVTVQVDCQPQYDAANGLITALAKCTTDGICQAAP